MTSATIQESRSRAVNDPSHLRRTYIFKIRVISVKEVGSQRWTKAVFEYCIKLRGWGKGGIWGERIYGENGFEIPGGGEGWGWGDVTTHQICKFVNAVKDEPPNHEYAYQNTLRVGNCTRGGYRCSLRAMTKRKRLVTFANKTCCNLYHSFSGMGGTEELDNWQLDDWYSGTSYNVHVQPL